MQRFSHILLWVGGVRMGLPMSFQPHSRTDTRTYRGGESPYVFVLSSGEYALPFTTDSELVDDMKSFSCMLFRNPSSRWYPQSISHKEWGVCGVRTGVHRCHKVGWVWEECNYWNRGVCSFQEGGLRRRSYFSGNSNMWGLVHTLYVFIPHKYSCVYLKSRPHLCGNKNNNTTRDSV